MPEPVDADPAATLPPLREVIAQFQLAARKGLGQHFLLDLNLTRRIVRAAGDLAGYSVIEIGPGPGGLTRALLESAAATVIAIERDARCVRALGGLAEAYRDRLVVVEGDALALDPATLAPPTRKIVANLPYNIATPLLIGWLRKIAQYDSLTLMVQKEVAQRLVAAAATADYGRLSVITQLMAVPRILFDIPASAFVPPPKVTSSVIQLVPRAARPAEAVLADIERVTAAAFGQRRKMLRSSLRALGVNSELLLDGAGIAATRRAEELSVAEFAAVAAAFAAMRRPPAAG